MSWVVAYATSLCPLGVVSRRKLDETMGVLREIIADLHRRNGEIEQKIDEAIDRSEAIRYEMEAEFHRCRRTNVHPAGSMRLRNLAMRKTELVQSMKAHNAERARNRADADQFALLQRQLEQASTVTIKADMYKRIERVLRKSSSASVKTNNVLQSLREHCITHEEFDAEANDLRLDMIESQEAMADASGPQHAEDPVQEELDAFMSSMAAPAGLGAGVGVGAGAEASTLDFPRVGREESGASTADTRGDTPYIECRPLPPSLDLHVEL